MDAYFFFKYFVMTLSGFFALLILIPLILPLGIFFGLIFLLAKWAIKLKYGNRAYKARGTDVVHGKETAHTLPVINVAVRIKGELSLKRIKDRTFDIIYNIYNKNGERRYKRLMEIYGREFGYNIWKRYDNFNIDEHVKEVTLDNVPIKLENEEEKHNSKNQSFDLKSNKNHSPKEEWTRFMEAFLERFSTKPFREGKPQWEMLVAKDDQESYTILFRFHHAISDGVYLSRMFCEDFFEEPYTLFSKYTPPHPLLRFLTSLWSFFLLPFGMWRIMSISDRNPLHGPQLCGRKRCFMSDRVTMEALSTIKKGSPTKTSIHAIVFSCVSYSISKHFDRKNSKITKISVVTPIPLQNKFHQIKLKNKFALGLIDFPVPLIKRTSTTHSDLKNGEDYPGLRRLNQIQKSFEEMGRNISMLPANSLVNVICSILPNVVAEALLSTKGCSVAISHLPGSKLQSKVYEGIIIDHMFWIPDREPMGVGFSIFSYNGKLRVGLMIDGALIASDEEGRMMMEDFENEVSNLVKELQKKIYIKEKENTSEILKLAP